MTNTNVTNFRKNVFDYLSRAIEWGEVINVSTKDGNAVVMSEEDYNSIMETLYLSSIPGMVERIKEAAAEPLSEGVPAEELEW